MRIVLTRLDRLGDLVLSTPAIRSVRRSWPRAHVTLVCGRYNVAAVEGNPDLDELAVLEPGESPARLGARWAGQTDLAIALAPRRADWRLIRATRASRRVGYTYRRRYLARLSAPWYLTKLVVADADPDLAERHPERPVHHEAAQVLDVVARAGARERCEELVVTIEERDRRSVAELPAGALTIQLAPRWLGGGSTPESFEMLLRELRSLGLPLILAYGDEVRVKANGCAPRASPMRSSEVSVPVMGRARLRGAVRLVLHGQHTGATHVASAVRRPVVVLFEHRYFSLASREWAPYRVAGACLRKPADESPAALAQSRAEILAAVRRLLDHA